MKRLMYLLISLLLLSATTASSSLTTQLEGTFSHDTAADQLIHFSAEAPGRLTLVNRATVNFSGDMEGSAHCFTVATVETPTNMASVEASCVFVGTIQTTQKVLHGTATLEIDLGTGKIEGVWKFKGGGPILSVSGRVEGVLASGSYSGPRGRR